VRHTAAAVGFYKNAFGAGDALPNALPRVTCPASGASFSTSAGSHLGIKAP